MKYASVIVDIAVENVDRLYTYRLDIPACAGQRVRVPFGNGGRTTEGFILSISDTCDLPDDKLKSVICTLEDYPVLDEGQTSLAYRMAKQYHCTLAQALRLMIPAQMRGMRVKERKVRGVRITDGSAAREYADSLITKDGKVRSQGAYDVIDFLLQADSAVSVKDLCEIIPAANTSIIKRLIDRGILTESYETVFRRPKTMRGTNKDVHTLTDEQSYALSVLRAERDGGRTCLVHGVTGSGKTEVYMRIIDDVIREGRGAIVLVPEISLTPQTVARFTDRFGDDVAVIHSRLSIGERFDEWRRIRQGRAKLVIGARSAVFAPVSRLGIIIIDEEHESSYVSEHVPNYNAVEVAQMRCKTEGGMLVLGSATPSVASYYRAVSGRYRLIELKNRVNAHPLPEVKVVDMRAEFLSGNNGVFGSELVRRLDRCIKGGEQAILFLNRRGYSNFVTCRACGYVWKCDDCDVSMTYHKSGNRMKCHYCGREARLPSVCPECGRSYIKYSGIGTEQVEEELKRLFPDVSCIRMDADTTRGKDAHMRLLSEFSEGRAQVLIGTQMIAKGLDFPNVTLVGIVSVDAMLSMPDFRNTERTFQLLTQVAGRAGRADKRGSVVLQTQNPEHPVIEFACEHDYKRFYAYAIQNRQVNLYPPFSMFVRVLFTSDDEDTSYNEAVACSEVVYKAMCGYLRSVGCGFAEIAFIYAMHAPIHKIQGRYRSHLLMKLARTKNTRALLDTIYETVDDGGYATLAGIEVNPTDML